MSGDPPPRDPEREAVKVGDDSTADDTTWDSSLETRLSSSPDELTTDFTSPEIQELLEQVLPATDRRLERQHHLAKGGMGQVDVVLDVALQRRIAKKIIGKDLSAMTQAVRLFLREAQITAQLDHPAIVPVHEVGIDELGRLFFTMKLVKGKTFESWMAASSPEPKAVPEASELQELLEVVIKLCDAMAFAHSRGVFHGDIKPPNVMVGEFGEVYLMDWGLAQLKDGALTRTSAALSSEGSALGGGTPSFMAPEQARNAPIDERTDVFGLGALLYFALDGRAPYRGKNVSETLMKARSGQFEPLTSEARPARVPRELARIVTKAMATDRKDRYATITDLGRDLRQFLRGGAEFPRCDVAAGEHIIRQGESGDEVFILVSGRARVYQEVDGEVHERGDLLPGAVFGEMAILISSPRTASVVAIEDCVLRAVTGEILEKELHGLKPWMAALITTLAERLKRREEEGASQ